MQEDIWKIIGILLLGGLIGYSLEQTFPFLFLSSLGVIAWQLMRLEELSHWIDSPLAKAVPNSGGQLYTILRKLARRDKKNKLRQRQLGGFLTQIRKAIGALPDAIVLIDDFGKIEWANNNALTILGVRWPADGGVRFTDLVRIQNLDAILKGPEPNPQGIEVASKIKRDTVINIKCLRYTDELRMVIARDVTRLVRVNQMQRDFVANVSHELKTPLTVLRGYVEIMLTQNKLPGNLLKPLEQMNLQTLRMELIVGDLLYLAKLESADGEPDEEVVDVPQMVHTVCEALQPLMDEKEHSLSIAIDSDLSLVGSSKELHSVLSNLLTNAIHYTSNNGTLAVSWRVYDETAVLSVKDNGPGIAEHHLDRLTRRFYRVDTNRSRESGGTGLGLAIVKHVLQRHNAKLAIQSKEGVGSEFCCVFPMTQTQASNANSSNTKTTQPKLQSANQ